MLIEIGKGRFIEPCTFTALIGPPGTVIGMINTSRDLQRYLFLYVSGNFSRILTHVDRNSGSFDTRRAFTAHQLLTILHETAHTGVFIEHDPTLFDGAWNMIPPIAAALGQVSRESTVILYSPAADRAFSLLSRGARSVICFAKDDPGQNGPVAWKHRRKEAQKMLDVG